MTTRQTGGLNKGHKPTSPGTGKVLKIENSLELRHQKR